VHANANTAQTAVGRGALGAVPGHKEGNGQRRLAGTKPEALSCCLHSALDLWVRALLFPSFPILFSPCLFLLRALPKTTRWTP
jgi:hypothetical protein